ncbi:hypothetical protein ScPMuIL_011911 [Solemya velum]
MQYSYKAAAHESAKNSLQQKERYDRKVREHKLEVGDRVLVRKVGLVGKQKLADKWEQEPYLVIKIPDNEIPVFKVKREDGQGPTRTLHRNLLAFNPFPAENTSARIVSKSNAQSPLCAGSDPSDSDSYPASDTDDVFKHPELVQHTNFGNIGGESSECRTMVRKQPDDMYSWGFWYCPQLDIKMFEFRSGPS